jgi:thiamine pyrophosphate-dependent acetolactate synthase large subunit-like protein
VLVATQDKQFAIAKILLNAGLFQVHGDRSGLIAIKQGDHQGGASAVRYGTVDFAGTAGSLGVPAFRADNGDELHDALAKALARRGPCLIDVAVDPAGYPAVLDAIRGGPSEGTRPLR